MIVRNEKELDCLLKDLDKYQTFALDSEYVDRGYPDVHFVGTSFAFKEGNNYHGYYIPLGHNTLEPQLDIKETMDKLKPYLEDETKLKILHNAKADFKSYGLQDVYLYDSRYFRWSKNPVGKPPEYSDINTETQFWDTMIASWLLQMDREHKLKTLSKELLGEEMTELAELATKESKTGVLRVDLVPIKDLGGYAWHDAIQTYKLYEYFKPLIEAEYNTVYYDLELPFVKVVTEMETQGSDIDTEYLIEMGEKIRAELEILKKQLYELAGEEFNINSTKQLSKILFSTLKLEPLGEENKKGDFCTDVNVLLNFRKRHKEYLSGEKLENKKYEIATALLRYRKLKKLLGTYVDGFLDQIVDRKLYSNFWQLGTRTGRLSSSMPNFQNIPTSKEFPIRKVFKIPDDNWVWGTLDYNQLELRIVTHVSQDKILLKVYQNNGDVHSQVTKDCFNLPCEVHEVKDKYPDVRRKGKQVSFGTVYGISGRGMADIINKEAETFADEISVEEARNSLDVFMHKYEGVAKYVLRQKRYGREFGFVKTLVGRKRPLLALQMAKTLGRIEDPVERRKIYSEISSDERRAVNCFDEKTEILTEQGWMNVWEIKNALGEVKCATVSLDGKMEWDYPIGLSIFPDYHGDVYEFKHRAFSALTTPNHKWLVYSKEPKRNRFVTSSTISLWGDDRILRTCENMMPDNDLYSDDFIRLVGWILTDGYYCKHRGIIGISQSKRANPEKVADINKLLNNLNIRYNCYTAKFTECCCWKLNISFSREIRKLFPERVLTSEFLCSLSQRQCNILLREMLRGDGAGVGTIKEVMCCGTKKKMDMFQMLCVLSGISSNGKYRDMSKYSPQSDKLKNVPKMTGCYNISLLKRDKVQLQKKDLQVYKTTCLMWCPTMKHGTVVARREGMTYITGQTGIQGGAADIVAIAMRNIRSKLRKSGDLFVNYRLLSQIHDEINIIIKKEKAEELFNMTKDLMENAVKLRIELPVEGHMATNWFDAK